MKRKEEAGNNLRPLRRFSAGLLFLLCAGLLTGCVSGGGGSEEAQQDISQAEGLGVDGKAHASDGEKFSPERQLRENKEEFFAKADEAGVERGRAEELFGRLCDDGVFMDGERKLSGIVIDDIDGNGQTDMLAMALDARELPFYGGGALWIYMNGDAPYCFDEESSSFYGWFDVFWADFGNDGNMEIVFSAQGTGCGAVGDSYKAVFQYKDHEIRRMALPSDLGEDYDQGIQVELTRETEADSYSAYCPYFDERISFRGENAREGDVIYEPCLVGGNVRGFFDLREAEYEGEKVLQASEYLSGEGGTVHCVAIARFLIAWEEDGTPKVLKWWVEEE